MENYPDKKSYDCIWDNLILAEIRNYQNKYTGMIDIIPNAKEEIWDKYCMLNKYCKVNYMKNPDGKLDRHKVAACYLIAIAAIRPMRFVGDIPIDENKKIFFSFNEKLGITVALSLIRAFFIAATKDNGDLSDEAKQALISKFDDGIVIPDSVNHGDYMDNYASEIRFAVSEGNIHILSIAHELYLLETMTKLL